VIAPVQIEGLEGTLDRFDRNAAFVETLEAGRIPPAWAPLGQARRTRSRSWAPLEIVSARGGQNRVFGSEYIWEVYKPLAQRRGLLRTAHPVPATGWLPALTQARPQNHDPADQRLLAGKSAPGNDPAFADALGKGLARFASFVGGQTRWISESIAPRTLKKPIYGNS